MSATYTLHKSTIMRNGFPIFMMSGVHTLETTVGDRKRLRERIVRLLNEDSQKMDPYVCDWTIADWMMA